MAYPGTVSLKLQNYLAIVRDVLESIAAHGFRRIVIVAMAATSLSRTLRRNGLPSMPA